ncbi:hypothetical protein [Archangium gephyra]|nr:hypothetical protein [Archangium gephyra]
MSKSGKLAVAVAVLAAGTAWAGARMNSNVWVNVTGREAGGLLGAAYNSPDTTQFIGCSVTIYPTGPSGMTCYARDPANNTVSCTTNSAELIKAALALNSDGYLQFAWDETGWCTWLMVNNLSSYTKK